MSVIKKKIPENEKRVLFEAIIDRQGNVPKKERKLITPGFLYDFLAYVKELDGKPTATYNLFRDFGSKFKISSKNLVVVCDNIKVARYCNLSSDLKDTGFLYAMTMATQAHRSTQFTAKELRDEWAILMANLIVSDIHDIDKLYTVYRFLYWVNVYNNEPITTNLLAEIFSTIRDAITKLGVPFDRRIKERFALACIHTYDAVTLSLSRSQFLDTAEAELVANMLAPYLFNDNEFDRAAPVLPKYYNPYTIGDYISNAISHGLEIDAAVGKSFLESCDDETRDYILHQLVAANGNNLRLCNNDRSDISKFINDLSWAYVTMNNRVQRGEITDYSVFKMVYPNGCPTNILDSFLSVCDYSTIPSESIPSLLTEDDKIRFIATRPDAAEQYTNLFRLPNGMIYLSSAVKQLRTEELHDLMNGYAEYMETVDDYREDGASMDVYMASYIKKQVSTETMIARCPRILRYISIDIADLPTEYQTMDEWYRVATNIPVVNITDSNLVSRLVRAPHYVQLNYHHLPFSPDLFGIEEVIPNPANLRSVMKAHPGYYFDINNEEVRKLIMEYLVDLYS